MFLVSGTPLGNLCDGDSGLCKEINGLQGVSALFGQENSHRRNPHLYMEIKKAKEEGRYTMDIQDYCFYGFSRLCNRVISKEVPRLRMPDMELYEISRVLQTGVDEFQSVPLPGNGKIDGTFIGEKNTPFIGEKNIAMKPGATNYLVNSDKWNTKMGFSIQIDLMKEMKLSIPQGYVKYYVTNRGN